MYKNNPRVPKSTEPGEKVMYDIYDGGDSFPNKGWMVSMTDHYGFKVPGPQVCEAKYNHAHQSKMTIA